VTLRTRLDKGLPGERYRPPHLTSTVDLEHRAPGLAGQRPVCSSIITEAAPERSSESSINHAIDAYISLICLLFTKRALICQKQRLHLRRVFQCVGNLRDGKISSGGQRMTRQMFFVCFMLQSADGSNVMKRLFVAREKLALQTKKIFDEEE
jgi:hypothetical protein